LDALVRAGDVPSEVRISSRAESTRGRGGAAATCACGVQRQATSHGVQEANGRRRRATSRLDLTDPGHMDAARAGAEERTDGDADGRTVRHGTRCLRPRGFTTVELSAPRVRSWFSRAPESVRARHRRTT
jgi:hypothetical protein